MRSEFSIGLCRRQRMKNPPAGTGGFIVSHALRQRAVGAVGTWFGWRIGRSPVRRRRSRRDGPRRRGVAGVLERRQRLELVLGHVKHGVVRIVLRVPVVVVV